MNKEFTDYYKVLGVDYKASEEEIRKAYHKLVKQFHPDVHSTEKISKKRLDEMHTRFTEITNAYKTLKDEYKRALYDIELRRYYRNLKNTSHTQETRNETRTRNERNQNSNKRTQTYSDYLKRRERQKRKNNSFIGKIKKSYNEIRNEEKQNPFYKRHNKMSEEFDKEFKDMCTTKPKEIVFKICKGTTHVFMETIYQIKKIRYITEDTVPKFIIRNRKLVGATILCTMIVTSGGLKKNQDNTNYEDNYVAAQEIVLDEEKNDDNNFEEDRFLSDQITLNRNYEIVSGDTLSRLSKNSNTPISKIKEINGMTKDTIYIGDFISLPYTIDAEDIKYYTLVVNTNGKTLYEIAREYNTDIETLITLNKDAIYEVGNNSYVILSDKIMVPNFITKKTLEEKKSMDIKFYK